MKFNLQVVGGNQPARSWRPRRRHLVGGAIIAGGLVLGAWLWFDPTLAGQGSKIMAAIFLSSVALMISPALRAALVGRDAQAHADRGVHSGTGGDVDDG